MVTKKKKEKPKIITKVEPVPIETHLLEEIPLINQLLDDDMRMHKAVEYASVGFSTSTIAAKLGIAIPTFSKWVTDGKALSSTDPNAPEAILFTKLAEGWSNARGLAEASLAQTKPEIFLTRGPGKLLGDDWLDTKGNVEAKDENKLNIGVEFIDALKLLRGQGMDLNEIIDQDKLQILGVAPAPKDILEEKGIDGKVTSLPGKLRQDALLLEQSLDLKYGDRGLKDV